MQPHQQRVVDEKKDLDVKIDALDKFLDTPICGGLADAEKKRLCHQLAYMRGYSKILEERVAAFGS
jgi:hypothetical protein